MPYGLDTPLAPRGLSGAYGLNTPVAPLGPVESSAGEVERGIHRGLSTIANTGQAALGQVIQPLAPEFGTSMIAGAINDMGMASQKFSPAVGTWDEVNGFGDTALYGAGKFGEMLPLMPLGMGAAGVGRIAGGALGAELGAAAAFAPLNVGDQAMQLQQDPAAAGMTPAQKLGHAGVVGGIQSLLEGAVPAGAVGRYANPHGVPRTLGAIGRGLVADTAKGIAAGSSEEMLQEGVGQIGKQSYDPDAQFDLGAIKEAGIGGAFGIAPMAGAHAIVAQGVDATAGGARLGAQGAKMVGAGARFMGEKAYAALPDSTKARLDQFIEVAKSPKEVYDFVKNGLDAGADKLMDGMDTASQYAADVKASSYDPDSEITTNAGRVANTLVHDAKGIVKHMTEAAEEAAPELVATLGAKAVNTARRAETPESRLKTLIDDFSAPPVPKAGELGVTSLAVNERMLQSENFFTAMNGRYTQMGRGYSEQSTVMGEAAKAVNEVNNNSDMTPEQMREAWTKVTRAALVLREELGGDKLKSKRALVAKWLSNSKINFSMALPEGSTWGPSLASDRALEVSKGIQVDVSKLSVGLDKAFARLGWTGPEYSNERSFFGKAIRKYAEDMAAGGENVTGRYNEETSKDKGIPREVKSAMRDLIQTYFKEDAGEIHAGIDKAIQSAQKGTSAPGQKADLYDLLHSQVKKGVRIGDVMEYVRDTDAAIANLERRPDHDEMTVDKLPSWLAERVNASAAYIKKMGGEAQGVYDMAMDILQQDAKEGLDAMLNPKGAALSGSIVQRIREADERSFGSSRRELQASQAELQRFAAGEDGADTVIEGDENKLRVSDITGKDVAPDAVEPVVRTDLGALTGHTTAEHGVGGELGYHRKEIADRGNQHVETGRVNVLQHVQRMNGKTFDLDPKTMQPKGGPRDEGITDDHVLDGLAADLRLKNQTLAAKLRGELEADGEDPTKLLTKLNLEYSKATSDKKAKKNTGEPWEVFDSARAAERLNLSGINQKKLIDLFWAEKKTLEFDGTSREFFEKFPHHFITEMNMGSGGEAMNSLNINAGLLTPKTIAAQGITESSIENGVIEAHDAEGNIKFFDMPKLMAEAYGKVRTRNEGRNDTGEAESHVDGQFNDDGTVSAQYAGDLRSAWANIIIAMTPTADYTPEYTLTPETLEVLTGTFEKGNNDARRWVAPVDLLIKRGAGGEGEVRVGDILGDKQLPNFNGRGGKGVRKAAIKTGEDTVVVSAPGEGAPFGTAKKKISALTEDERKDFGIIATDGMFIDTPALMKEVARILGVDMKNPSRQVYFGLLNEGIKWLRNSGEFHGLAPTTVGTTGNKVREGKQATKHGDVGTGATVVHAVYRGLRLADRPHYVADGEGTKRVANTKETELRLKAGDAAALSRASRLDFDSETQKVARLSGFIAALEKAIEKGATGADTLSLQSELRKVKAEEDAAHKVYASINKAAFPKKKAEADAILTVKTARRVQLEDQLEKAGEKIVEQRKEPTRGAVRSAARDAADEYRADGKPTTRSDLESMPYIEQLALLESLLEGREIKSGQDDALPDGMTGTTGKTERLLKDVTTLEDSKTTREKISSVKEELLTLAKVIKAAPQKSVAALLEKQAKKQAELEKLQTEAKNGTGAPASTQRLKTVSTTTTVPELQGDVEAASIANLRPGTLPVTDRAALDKAMKPSEKSTAVVEAKAPKKADGNLQRLLEDVAADNGTDALEDIKPEMYKSWHAEVSKIDTKQARSAAKAIERLAEANNVDLKTGQYRTGESTHSETLRDFYDRTPAGPAELRVVDGEVHLFRGAKDIGNIVDGAGVVAADLAAGKPVFADVVKTTRGYSVEITRDAEAKAMPAYKGADNLPVAKPILGKTNERIPMGEKPGKAALYENKTYSVNKVMQAELTTDGDVGEIRFRDEAYSPQRFAKEFGSEARDAIRNILRDLADGREANEMDKRHLNPSRLMRAWNGLEVSELPTRATALRDMKVGPKVEPKGRGTKYSMTLPDGTVMEGENAAQTVEMINRAFNGSYARVKEILFREVDGKKVEAAGATYDAATPLGFAISVSRNARTLIGSTGMHEMLHGLFRVLGRDEKNGTAALEKIGRALTGPVMQARVEKLLMSLPLSEKARESIVAEMKADPEEAAAYAFQFWMSGDLKLGPETEGFFTKIANMIRKFIGITREYERTDAFLNAFISGDLAKADFKASALEAAFAEKKGDQMLQRVKEGMEPVMKVVNTVFDSSVKAMERLNLPEATELMRKYTGYGNKGGYVNRVSAESNIYASKIQKVMDQYEGKPEDIAAAIKSIYEQNPDTLLAKQIKAFMEEVNEYAGREKDYLPTIWDYNKIEKNRKEFNAAIKDFGTNKDAPTEKAVLDILGDMGYAPADGDRVDFHANYQHEKAKWIQQDPTQFMRSFIVQSVKQTEHKKIFPGGRADVEVLLKKIQHAKGGGDEAYYKARQFVDAMEGKLGQSMNRDVRQLMKAVLTVGNVVTLPFSIFSAMIDPFHLASRSSSLGEAGQAYAKGIGSIFRSTYQLFGGKSNKNTPEEQFAEDIGAIEHSMMTSVLGDLYLGDQAGGWTKKVNDWFFKANMLDGWTRQLRVAATMAGQRFILTHSGKGEHGEDGKSLHSAHYMEELGLKPEDVEIASDGNIVITDRIKMALNQFVDESVVRPDASTNAIWMNDPRFGLLAHMKRFTFAFNDRVLNRVMNEVGRGNIAPLGLMAASLPVTILAGAGRHLLKGDYDTWMKGAGTGKWFEYMVNQSGFNGKMQFGLDAMHDVQSGGTPFDSAMGPDLGLVKKTFGAPHHVVMDAGGEGILGQADHIIGGAQYLGRDKTEGGEKIGTARP